MDSNSAGTTGATAPLRYVLSAGRTGTVFLEHFLNRHFPGVTAEHEPRVTRTQMMLANLRNDTGFGGTLLARWFTAARARREAAAPGNYVELNPFLCAMTDLLPAPGRSLRVVHMVRDPADWSLSMTSFKASKAFRPFIDLVPFAKPYPSPRPADWTALDAYEKGLWRWNWCNSRIAALRPLCAAYVVVRYEDLFSGDEDRARDELRRIRTALALADPGPLDLSDMRRKVNPRPETGLSADREAAARICGALARDHGYAY